MFLFLWLSGLVTTLCVFFYFWGTVSEKPQWKSVMSTRNWIECSESDKVRTEVRVTKPCVQYWSNLVFFIFHLSHSVFTWSLFLVQPWSCCKVVSLILSFFVLLTCLVEFLICLYVVVYDYGILVESFVALKPSVLLVLLKLLLPFVYWIV